MYYISEAIAKLYLEFANNDFHKTDYIWRATCTWKIRKTLIKANA